MAWEQDYCIAGKFDGELRFGSLAVRVEIAKLKSTR